jgi:hypothetical protein
MKISNNKKEIEKIFKDLSNSGALMGISYNEPPDEPRLIVDNFELLHHDDQFFWLLFRFIEYHYGDREIHYIKVEKMTKEGDGFLLEGYPAGGDDDETTKHLYVIKPLDDDIKQWERWKDWKALKEEHKDMFKRLDEYSFKENQMSVLGDSSSRAKYEWEFINARNDIWRRIKGRE